MTEGRLRRLLVDLDVTVVHKNHRNWIVAKCPFAPYLHEFGSDHNPSFCIKVNDEGYSGFNCFTCKQRGNLTYLINRLGSLRERNYAKLAINAMMDETPDSFKDFDEAMDSWDEDPISPIDKPIYLRMYPLAWEDPRSRAYLVRRGFSERSAIKLDLRFDPDEQRILFPVYDRNMNLYGFTGRTILEKRDWPTDTRYGKVKDYAGLKKDQLLLGEQLYTPGLPLLLVEGLFALLTMVEIEADEFCNPRASMGSFLSEAQRDLLIEEDVPVYLLYDDDKAGDEGLFGVLGSNGKHEGNGAVDKLKAHVPTFLCLYPEDASDPDELEKEEVREMVCGKDNEPC